MGRTTEGATEGAFVAIMRQHKDGPQILLAVREDGKGLNLIGGRHEEGETSEECAVREALEETGLAVALHGQIGDDLLMIDDEGNTRDIARIFSAWTTGTLCDSDESNGFRWVSAHHLPDSGVVVRPCPGYPKGRTYAMIEMALCSSEPVFSNFISDPEDLAMTIQQDACGRAGGHRASEKQLSHMCDSSNCSPQTCFGGDNVATTRCVNCGLHLETFWYGLHNKDEWVSVYQRKAPVE